MKPERNRWVNFVAVSSGRQAEKESPKEQERENQKVIEAYDGICVATIRIGESRSIVRYDEAIGGNNAKGVEGYKQLDEIITGRKADFIVLRSMDRLARTTALSTTIQSLCEQAKITIYCRNSRPSDHEMETGKRYYLKQSIQAILAEDENRKKVECSAIGREAAVKSGKMLFPPPYGYRLMYHEDGTKAVITVKDEAEVVRLIFDSVLKGMSIEGISNMLNRRGLAHRETIWQGSMVRRILDRGLTYSGKVSMKKPSGEMIVADGNQDAIVDSETVERVGEELTRRQSFRRGVSASTLFTRSLVCGSCGRYLISRGGMKTPRGTVRAYDCRPRYPDGNKGYCRGSHVYEDNLLAHVPKAIEYLMSDEVLEEFARGHDDNLIETRMSFLAEAQEELSSEDGRNQRLLDAYLNDIIDIGKYEQKKNAIDANIKRIEDSITEVRAMLEGSETPSEKMERLRASLIEKPLLVASSNPVEFNAWFRGNFNFVIRGGQVVEYVFL
ncbi:MAG: recombinase family protein [Chloroflexota bacterium]